MGSCHYLLPTGTPLPRGIDLPSISFDPGSTSGPPNSFMVSLSPWPLPPFGKKARPHTAKRFNALLKSPPLSDSTSSLSPRLGSTPPNQAPKKNYRTFPPNVPTPGTLRFFLKWSTPSQDNPLPLSEEGPHPCRQPPWKLLEGFPNPTQGAPQRLLLSQEDGSIPVHNSPMKPHSLPPQRFFSPSPPALLLTDWSIYPPPFTGKKTIQSSDSAKGYTPHKHSWAGEEADVPTFPSRDT